MEWQRYGRSGILVQFAEYADERAYGICRSVSEALEQNAPASVREFVPGFTTLFLELTSTDRQTISDCLRFLAENANRAVPSGMLHEIPVHYNGVDLNRVAECHRLTVAEVIRLHSTPTYEVYLTGFSPGFPYLGGLPPELHTPRLTSPRPRVPAGSIAIGGIHTGIYPVSTPGGWNLIGTTEVPIFDRVAAASQNPMDAFRLKMGDRVRFVPV